jgi:hypothetical protein
LGYTNIKDTRDEIYETRDIRRQKTAEMKFMRRTPGYTLLARRRNEDILGEIKVDTVEKKLAQYKHKWLNVVSRMEDIGYPKRLLDYRHRKKKKKKNKNKKWHVNRAKKQSNVETESQISMHRAVCMLCGSFCHNVYGVLKFCNFQAYV